MPQDAARDIALLSEWLAGADGCSGGWIVVLARRDGIIAAPRVVPAFSDITFAAERPGIIAVDMPIGLPARSPTKGRLAEAQVRDKLGARRSSVFRVPSRRAVYASVAAEPADERGRFFAACRIARETADDRKAFAKQGFYILPKLVEVDRFLAGHPDWTARVFETHPEAVFWRLNGEQPVPLPKKVKSRVHAPGLALRRTLLMKAGLPREVLSQEPPRGAARDDLVDAFACLVTAQRIAACQARSFPEKPPRDERGLAMAIWV
jgi:predicted RNase H-like nuclease